MCLLCCPLNVRNINKVLFGCSKLILNAHTSDAYVQHMVESDASIIHINTHGAFKDPPKLLWKHNVDGTCDQSVIEALRRIRLRRTLRPITASGCCCAVETILHKPDKLSEWPTFGPGLDRTNWITAQSSFHNAKQTVDQDNVKFKSDQYEISNLHLFVFLPLFIF